MERTDRKLVEAHLGGDAAAFEGIVRRHGPAVLGYLVNMTHNRDKAEDLFQETFQKACRKLDTFRGENLRPWLLAIATNSALTERRLARRRPAFVSLDRPVFCRDGEHCPAADVPDGRTEDDPQERLLLEERKSLVRQALMSLPERQRAAVVLYYYHKLSCSQIADALGCTLGSVKTHMFRGLKRLAERLPSGGMDKCRI